MDDGNALPNETGLSGKSIWIEVARDVLIESGHDQVKVDRLSTMIGLTRGSFYHHFKHRADLLRHLVSHWEDTNSTAILRELRSEGTPLQRLRNLSEMWIAEAEYSPQYDSAMRAWARTDAAVAIVVRRVDDRRIDAFRDVFLDAGYDAPEAGTRARVIYYHQVGYYAMGVKETIASRLDNLGMYLNVLLGAPPSA